jgi:hypothetical protein
VGDLLYADTTTSLAKLADVAVGNALISGGVAAAPSWGKIGLATHVSGTLPIANGGTNSTATPTNGGVVYGTGTAQAYSTAGTSGQVLTSAGAAAPTWTTATDANTASAIVKRDASGNFSAGTITSSASSLVIGTSGATTRGYLYNDSTGFGLLTNTGGWAARVDFGTTNVSFTGTIKRQAAGKGWLDGDYSSVETSATTGAIYSIGGASYFPTSSSLNTMYGIGYAYTGANQFSIGTYSGAPNNVWGMYTAAGGTPYIFLDASNGGIYGAGALVMKGNVTAYSDERVKTNWRDLQPNFIEQLAKVKHGIYDRTDQEITQVGVSAQSLQPILEHAVIENDHGQLSVAYGNAALVACIKLAERVLELEAKLEQLTKDKS